MHLRILSPTSPSYSREVAEGCATPSAFHRRRQLSLGTLGRAEGAEEEQVEEVEVQPEQPRCREQGRAGLRLVLPTVVIAAPSPYDHR